MDADKHVPTVTPATDSRDDELWVVQCSCGWESKPAKTQGKAMFYHSMHSYSANRPYPPQVHEYLQALQGKEIAE